MSKFIVNVPSRNKDGNRIWIEWTFQERKGAEALAKKYKGVKVVSPVTTNEQKEDSDDDANSVPAKSAGTLC